METILLIIHVFIAVALIGLILIQQGKGSDMGAGFGAGSSGTVFGARGAASFLSKVTAGLAFLFLVTSISMGILASKTVGPATSVTDDIADPVETPAEQAAKEEIADPAGQADQSETAARPEQDQPAETDSEKPADADSEKPADGAVEKPAETKEEVDAESESSETAPQPAPAETTPEAAETEKPQE